MNRSPVLGPRAVPAMSAQLLAAAAAHGAGEVVTVTTLEDTVDFPAPQRVSNLPGPDGIVSFREACLAVDNTPGPQTVEFAIPTSEYWLMTDRALLRLEDGAFSLNDDGTTIDFSTQTDFAGDTNPDGFEVGIYGLQPNAWGVAAIFVNGDGCTIRGLDRVMQRGYGVQLVGHDNHVVGCTISGPLYAGVMISGWPGAPATGNVVGGTGPDDRNVLSAGNSGVRIDGPAENNIVIGNTLSGSFAGVEVRSAYCCPDYAAVDNRIGGLAPGEGNHIADAGHYGEEGFPVGSQVSIEYATGTIVEGNTIGATFDGSASAVQVGPTGVNVFHAIDTVIRGNQISGIAVNGVNHYEGDRFGVGIGIAGDAVNTVIEDNRIGTDAAGTGAVPNHRGIAVSPFTALNVPVATRIGGPGAGQGNRIAFNELDGVIVNGLVDGVTISGNSIEGNGALGIDLHPWAGDDDVTPNDPGDGDSQGGNALQNFPVLAAATTTSVDGTLDSTPSTSFTIEIFASDACDPSGFGEGATFVGAATVVTDASGQASFSVPVGGAGAGQQATATATNDVTGDTSEFSACVPIDGGDPVAGDVTGDGWVDVADLVEVILRWGPCPAEPIVCIGDANGDGAVDVADLVAVIVNWN